MRRDLEQRPSVPASPPATSLPSAARCSASPARARARPVERHPPQKVKFGLYAEQLSGSPFTAPQSTNQRSWLYRIRPTVKHSARYRRIDKGFMRTAPAAREESDLPIGQLRWGPIP